MSIPGLRQRAEDFELITNYDLIAAANALMGNIDLDPASSKFANDYVQAEHYYTPSDDGLNQQQWFGNVYVFPPNGAYFWDAPLNRWKITRSSARTLSSSHAVWFRRLYREWVGGQIKQGLYFTNCPDMIRYEQKIFDFPICILKTKPILVKRTSTEVSNHVTATSMVIYLPPVDSSGEAVENFVDIYSPKGRVLC